jgi:hypothetical protein
MAQIQWNYGVVGKIESIISLFQHSKCIQLPQVKRSSNPATGGMLLKQSTRFSALRSLSAAIILMEVTQSSALITHYFF